MARFPLRRSDVLTLAAYCGLFAVVAPIVALLAVRAWTSGGPVPTTLVALGKALGGIGTLAAGGLGTVLGLLVLLWVDDMKRYTALVMSVALGAALWLFVAIDVFFRYLNLQTSGAFVVAFGVAFVAAGGYRLHVPPSSVQFPRASGGLFVILSGLAMASFLQVYVAPSPDALATSVFTEKLPLSAVWARATTPTVDAAATGLFVVASFGLVTYEAREKFLVLGPPRSGKTTLQTGFYHVIEELDAGQTKPNPSEPLATMYREFLAADGWGPLDDPTPSLEYNRLRFRYQIGRLFARYQTFEAYDTAGEHTGQQLVAELQRLTPTRVLSLSTVRYVRDALSRPFIERPESGRMESHDAMARLLARELLFSDTVVLVVDAASLVQSDTQAVEQTPPAEYFGTYQQVLTTLEESILPEKDVHIVVTKADHLDALYREYRGASVGLPHHRRHESFRQFAEYLLREREDIFPTTNELFRMAPEADVSVVHYEMDAAGDGQPTPVDPVEVHGFAETLEAMTDG